MADLTMGGVLAIIGAGLAVGLSAIGSGIGVGIAGAAAAGASVSRKEKFSTFLVFQAVPQTQAIYGLLVGVLILLSTGVLGGGLKEIPLPMGLAALGAGIAVGLGGLSAIGQGITAAAGITTAARDDASVGRGLVFSVIPETQAIYGLLTAILILSFTGFLTAAEGVSEAMGWAALGAGFAVGFAALSAIGQGITAASGIVASARRPGAFGKSLVFSVIPETQAIYGLLVAVLIMAFTGILTRDLTVTIAAGFAAIGSGLAVGLAGLSAIGQGITAASGIAATTEDERMFGKSLVFSVIPETQAIYGLLVAVLIMAFTGILTGNITITLATGMASIGSGLAVGLAGLSAIGQGITAAAGIDATSRSSEVMGRSLIFAVIAETFAIFGLLVAILILVGIGIVG